MNPALRRRRLTAVIARAILVVAIADIVTVRILHHERAELEGSPSYRFGVVIMDSVVEDAHASGHAREDCRSALRAHPAAFAGYSPADALIGCVDEWVRVNR